jgi:phosphate-selective porin OprO/OprP
MSHRDPVNDQVRVRVRSENRSSPLPLVNVIADTGFVTASSQTLFNLQTAAVAGPVTLQGEYLANLVNGSQPAGGPNAGTLVYQGFYAEGLVFLTGESRTWNPKTMTFNRVVPVRNFGFEDGRWCGGTGAWELGARYTYLNLNDGPVRGGRLNNVTVGVNWYWNPNMKAQLNYDYVYRDEAANPLAEGAIHSLGARLAVDF